jgi:hypothetical protein
MQTARVALRIATALFCLGAMAVAGAQARAAGVYRCPDGSYQDKPCGDGARLVTRTSRTPPPEKGQDQQCLSRAKLAEQFARERDGGASPESILARVDKEMLPYEERVVRKKFVVDVLQLAGGPAEVRATVEADCLERKAAAARKAAEEKAAAEQAEATAVRKAAEGAASASQASAAARDAREQQEARVRACEDARLALDSAKAAERGGGTIDALDALRARTRAAQGRVRKYCD